MTVVLSIAITTSPRPIPTLARSLASLRRAGFTEPVTVFADGEPEDDAGDAEVIVNDPPRGGLKNWAYALECMVERCGWDWLLLLEDDVTWCRDGRDLLLRDLAALNGRSDVGYLSCYIHNTVARELERKTAHEGRGTSGIHESALGWLCHGSQAYAIPRYAAEWLLRDDQFQNYRDTWRRNRNRDQVASKCLSDMGLRTLFRVPGLVNHDLGSGNSSLRAKPPRNTRYFQGPPA